MNPVRTLASILFSLASCAAPQPSPDAQIDAVVTAPPQEPAASAAVASSAPLALAASSCVREISSTTSTLSLKPDGREPYATMRHMSGELQLPAHRSRSGTLRAEQGGLTLKGFAELRSLPLAVPGAFEGIAFLRDNPSGLVQEVNPRSDGAFDVTLATPPGMKMIDERALVMRASCDEIKVVTTMPPSYPVNVPGQHDGVFVSDDIPIAKTSGGKPFAHISTSQAGGCNGKVVVVETRGDAALVRVYLQTLIVYGWVPARVLKSAPATGATKLDPCEFGMVGVLSSGQGANRPPRRYTCSAPVPLMVSTNGAEGSVGQLAADACVLRSNRDSEHDFIEVDGRDSVSLTLQPLSRLFARKSDLASCKRVEGDGWTRCD